MGWRVRVRILVVALKNWPLIPTPGLMVPQDGRWEVRLPRLRELRLITFVWISLEHGSFSQRKNLRLGQPWAGTDLKRLPLHSLTLLRVHRVRLALCHEQLLTEQRQLQLESAVVHHE